MNNIFSINRFWLTLQKDLRENGKRYLSIFAVYTIIITIIATLVSTHHCIPEGNSPKIISNINRNLLIMMVSAYFILVQSAGPMIMNPMLNKASRISYLLLPSSNFEKFFSRWLISTIGLTAIFLASVAIADILRVAISSALYPDAGFPLTDFGKLIFTGEGSRTGYIFRTDPEMPFSAFRFYLLMVFSFQSLFMLGATFKAKNAFLLTVIALTVLTLLFVSLCSLAIWGFYPDFNSFGYVLDALYEKFIQAGFSDAAFVECSFYFGVCWTLACWTLAFFRFRESEIIERL